MARRVDEDDARLWDQLVKLIGLDDRNVLEFTVRMARSDCALVTVTKLIDNASEKQEPVVQQFRLVPLEEGEAT